MIAIGEMFIRLLTDNGEFKTGMVDSEKVLDKFAKTTNNTKQVFMALAKTAIATATVLGTAMGFAVKEAMQSEQANMRLFNAMRNVGMATKENFDALDGLAQKYMKVSGVSDETIKDSMVQLLNLTRDYNVAQKYTKTAMDVSAATGKDLTSVTRALGMAYGGNTGMLKRMGIVIPENIKGMEALDLVTKRYAGSMEAMANTTEGRFKRLRTGVTEFAERIGTDLMPTVQDLIAGGQEALVWWEQFLNPDMVARIVVSARNILSFFIDVFAPSMVVFFEKQFQYWGEWISAPLTILKGGIPLLMKHLRGLAIEENAAYKELNNNWKAGEITVEDYRQRVEDIKNSFLELKNSTKEATELTWDWKKTLDAVIASSMAGFSAIGEQLVATNGKMGEGWKTVAKIGMGTLVDMLLAQVNAMAISYGAMLWNPATVALGWGGLAATAAADIALGAAKAGIAMLAEGGLVTRPTLAMVGESGPEMVIPLSNQKAINNYTNNVSGKGITLVVQAQKIDDNTNWDKHIQKIKRAEARYAVKTGSR